MRIRAPVAFIAVVLVSCQPAATPTPLTRTISGTFTLTQGENVRREVSSAGELVECLGTGGYSDIRTGVAVVVRDASSTIVGTGRLEVDNVAFQALDPATSTRSQRICPFRFRIAGLPDADFYSVEVSQRGELTYSRAELEQSGWSVDLKLGP